MENIYFFIFRYDFVVIGGGSAGATVASRLSEEPRFSVLLLEAGLDEPTGTQIPSFFFNFIGTDIDWQYNTESEDTACLNKDDRKCYWPRGKVCLHVYLKIIFVKKLIKEIRKNIKRTLTNYHLINMIFHIYIINKKK